MTKSHNSWNCDFEVNVYMNSIGWIEKPESECNFFSKAAVGARWSLSASS